MKEKTLVIVLYAITFFIFIIGTAFFSSGQEMGYIVLNFYLVMPITSFVIGVITGIKKTYLKWLYPIFCGILGLFVPTIIFGTTEYFMLMLTLLPSLVGVILGTGTSILIKKYKRKQ